MPDSFMKHRERLSGWTEEELDLAEAGWEFVHDMGLDMFKDNDVFSYAYDMSAGYIECEETELSRAAVTDMIGEGMLIALRELRGEEA